MPRVPSVAFVCDRCERAADYHFVPDEDESREAFACRNHHDAVMQGLIAKRLTVFAVSPWARAPLYLRDELPF